MFDNQFEINIVEHHDLHNEHKKFKFQVKDNNKVLFYTDDGHKSREECRKHIVEIIDKISKGKIELSPVCEYDAARIEAKETLKQPGTSEDHKIHFFSSDLKSKEKAQKLSRKAAEKLPFCKISLS